MNEFEIINKYFNFASHTAILGIGDDAALISKNKKEYTAISTDTLNLDYHFTNQSDPYYLGWKSLAVNISDILAMGGTPKYALLSLSIEKLDKSWLAKFSKGLRACAKNYDTEIIGGDTNKGSKSISITIIGDVNKNNVLKRDALKANDELWLTDEIGYAALHFQQSTIPKKDKKKISNCLKKKCCNEFLKPSLPFNFINDAKTFINAAIDLSDGLAGDIKHLCQKNGYGAKVELNNLPIHKWFVDSKHYEIALAGGEDYQILFTASRKHHNKILNLLKIHNHKGSMIGTVTKTKEISYFLDGSSYNLKKDGHNHFA